jgi:uncharacterized protein (TIGR00730 family)
MDFWQIVLCIAFHHRFYDSKIRESLLPKDYIKESRMKESKLRDNNDDTIPLSNEASVKEIIIKTVSQLWDIVNNLTRLRPTNRPFYRVSIFGSARVKPGTPVYDEVKRLAKTLSSMGCEVITGGGPGLMQAANEGAHEGRSTEGQRSVGIRIALPFEQSVNKFVDDSYEHKTFFTRLHHFALASDAFVVVPGGIGTVLETLMIWQLLQVKHLRKMPLILIGEMYQDLLEWSKEHMLSETQPLASPEDMRIPSCVTNADQAISIIEADYQSWLRRKESAT